MSQLTSTRPVSSGGYGRLGDHAGAEDTRHLAVCRVQDPHAQCDAAGQGVEDHLRCALLLSGPLLGALFTDVLASDVQISIQDLIVTLVEPSQSYAALIQSNETDVTYRVRLPPPLCPSTSLWPRIDALRACTSRRTRTGFLCRPFRPAEACVLLLFLSSFLSLTSFRPLAVHHQLWRDGRRCPPGPRTGRRPLRGLDWKRRA